MDVDMTPEYLAQLAKLERNARLIIEREATELKTQFAFIDRAPARNIREREKIAPVNTIHDFAANNPALRASMRLLERKIAAMGLK